MMICTTIAEIVIGAGTGIAVALLIYTLVWSTGR